MKRYQQIAGQLNAWLFLVLVALLPFPQITLRYAFVLWLVSWLLEGRWLRRPQSIRKNKIVIPFLLFGLWYAWKALSVFWSPDHAAWAWQMERYMAFALLVPVGIWGVNNYYDWKKAGRVLMISCLCAVPFYLAVMTVLYYHPELIETLHLKGDWHLYLHPWHLFVADNISFIKHRLFLCSIELVGAMMAFMLYRKRPFILIPSLLVMLSVIPLTGSRQSILTVAAMMVVGLLMSLPRRYRWRYGVGILLLGVVLGGGLLKLHPRMQQFDFASIKQMREVSYEHDVRLNIYGCALQQPEDYLAYGFGAGQSTGYLMDIYREKGFDYYIVKQYHAHNQYLQELMEIGIPGLVFFFLAWLSIPIFARKEDKRFALQFFTLFFLNMNTDCMFGMFDGIVLWAFGMVFLLIPQIEPTDALSPPSPVA
ncbi:MAG: O-antigen ligase family protein [Paludibacteraceae bacterium]|nr:O-antigen ligase family protein [Paludibacteraceae bacterium]